MPPRRPPAQCWGLALLPLHPSPQHVLPLEPWSMGKTPSPRGAPLGAQEQAVRLHLAGPADTVPATADGWCCASPRGQAQREGWGHGGRCCTRQRLSFSSWAMRTTRPPLAQSILRLPVEGGTLLWASRCAGAVRTDVSMG